jgi:hypothetical protein
MKETKVPVGIQTHSGEGQGKKHVEYGSDQYIHIKKFYL